MSENKIELPLYWKAPYQSTLITEIVDIRQNEVAFKQTIFYPGGGGQSCDTGILEFRNESETKEYKVISVYKEKDTIWHKLDKNEILFSPGQQVLIKLDWEVRYSLMRTHTAQHLFSHFLKKKFDCDTLKANFDPYIIDIEIEKELTAEQLFEVLREVNETISKNSKVKSIVVTQEEYQKKYKQITRGKVSKEPTVRLIEIEEINDVVCCGGTHIENLLEIQGVVLQENKHSKVKLVVGEQGLNYANKQRKYLMHLEKLTTKKEEKLISTIENKFDDYLRVNKALIETLTLVFQNIVKTCEKIGEVNYTFLQMLNVDREALINSIKTLPSNVFMIIYGFDNILYFISTSKVSSGDIVKRLRETYSYKGGGNQKFAQVKVEDEESVVEIEKMVKELIQKN